jgi:serine/threonine protein kinase/WD40 repeat protein
MERLEILLDLLDSWDDLNDAFRVSPEEFCKEHPELLEDFRKVLQQRGVLAAMLNGENSPALNPDAMIERLQSGRFPAVKFHDKGGLGWVYIARDRELGRTVALKCLQPDPSTDPVACQRFVREAEITARLEHPGIVPIYGMGSYGVGNTAKPGAPSYAMRFVQGETLRDTIRELHETYEKIDWRSIKAIRILRSFVTVCETVAFAHSRHVIHRDLKSANIMLGAYGETLVLDWGLAKLQDDMAESSIPQESRSTIEVDYNATQTGATLGTIGFMSPEQAAGAWDKVDTASDIFSLGAILFQILTDQCAYSGSDALEAAKSCRFRPPESIKSGIPKPLLAICQKAMQAIPAERYATALDLKTDIERYLADEPVSSRQESILEKTQRLLRKHRTIAQMAALMALATIIMLSTFLSFAAKKNDELKTAYDNEEAAKVEAILQSNRVQEALLASVRENYVANMSQVSQALSDRQPARLADMLSKTGPRIGSPIDPRGIEWWMSWKKTYGGMQPLDINGRDVSGMRLVDGGKKVVVWDSQQRLQIIDTQTSKLLFETDESVTVPLNVLIEDPSQLPCSEDASTIAIHKETEVEIYRWDSPNDTYSLSQTVDQGNRVFGCALSHDGQLLLTGDFHGNVYRRDLKSGRIERYDVGKGKPLTSLQLSINGHYLSYFSAFEDGGSPTVLDLTNGATISVPIDMKGAFYRCGFGHYDTLLAWNKERVVTLAITASKQLTPLWETDLLTLVNNDVMLGPSESIREWISLTDECRRLSESAIRDRIHSGKVVDTVRSTTLAIMKPRRQIASERDYRQVGYHVFSREPSRKKSGNAFFDIQSKRPLQISEFANANLDFVVDVSLDGSTALIRDLDGQYSTIASDSWNRESIDRHDLAGPIQSLAWTDDQQLLSITQPPFAYSNSTAEYDRCRAPFDQTTKSDHRTLSLIVSAKPAEDCSVVADYLENTIRVETLDAPEKEYKFEYETKANSFDNDMLMVRVYPWNRRVTTPSPAFVNLVDNEVRRQPLRLPWVLAVPKYESAENNGDAFEPDLSDHKSRFLIVDYEANRVVNELDVQDTAVLAVTISTNGRGIALVSGNLMGFVKSQKTSLLHTWLIDDNLSVTKGQVIPVDADARSIAMNPSGTHVAIGSLTGQVVVVDLQSKKEVMRADVHEGLVRAITFSPDGTRLASAGEDQTVRFYSTRDWQEVIKVNCQSIPTCLAFDQQSQTLAIGDEAGHIAILSAARQKDVYDLAYDWLKQESTAAKGEATILSELWSEFVTTQGRSEVEVQAGLRAIESLRGKVRDLSFDELRQQFKVALPPSIDDFFLGVQRKVDN